MLTMMSGWRRLLVPPSRSAAQGLHCPLTHSLLSIVIITDIIVRIWVIVIIIKIITTSPIQQIWVW